MLIVAPTVGFDSLVSLVEADAYHAAMGNAWSASDDSKEAALRRATQYVLARYRLRDDVLDPVHGNVAAAVCELALRALGGMLYIDVEPAAIIEETIGPITTRYAAPFRDGQRRFALIDDLLADLLIVGSRYQIPVVRA